MNQANLLSWDVPVELSPNVYDALSRVQSLQSLHIRLDVASITRVSTVTYGTSTSMGPEFVQLANTQYFPPVSGTAQSSWAPGALTSVTAANTSKLATMRIERRRFGNIHDLRELRITAIDNLDCLDQIKTCLAESTRSLRSLSLSLSHALVRKARKPASNAPAGPAVVDPADDDEAMTEPNTPDTNAQAPAAPNDADIKRERQAQELTLARILGFERLTAEDKRLDRSLKATAKYVKLNGATADQYQQLQQHLEAVVKSSALSHSERNRIQELVKSVNDRLDQSGLPKLSKKKPKSKSPKQTATSKSQPASFAWSTQAPPLPEDPTNWESFPTQPPAGSGSKGIANAGPFLYGAGGKNDSSTTHDHALADLLIGAGPSVISEVLGDPQFIPSSSSHTSHTNYKVTNPKPVSTSYSYGVPKHLPPAQPPLFSHNAYSYSHAGTVSSSSYYIDSESLSHFLTELHQFMAANDCLYHPHSSMSKEHANIPGQANGKPVTQPPSPEDPSGVDSDSDDRSSLDEFEKSKEGVDAGTADQADGLQNQENGLDVDVDMDHPDAGDESDGNEAASELSDAGNGGKLHDDSTEDVKMTDSSSLLKENDPLPNEATGINNGLTCSKPPNTRSTFHSAQEEKKVVEHDRSLGKTKNSEEVMQDYIRMTHGFSLEEFSLYLIPLKPSIIAKAFNLSCLRNLSLYSVGPQGAFWTMLEKSLAQGLELKLQIIRTDDVSNACVQCISKLNGLLQLHLTRRSTKDFDSTTTKAPATLDEIRKLILVKHLPTLQSLALTNNEDDKWELNGKCFRLLAAKGKQLKELAFSTDSSGFVRSRRPLDPLC